MALLYVRYIVAHNTLDHYSNIIKGLIELIKMAVKEPLLFEFCVEEPVVIVVQ